MAVFQKMIWKVNHQYHKTQICLYVSNHFYACLYINIDHMLCVSVLTLSISGSVGLTVSRQMAEEAKLQGVTREEAEKKLQEPNSGEKIEYMMVYDNRVSMRGNDPI